MIVNQLRDWDELTGAVVSYSIGCQPCLLHRIQGHAFVECQVVRHRVGRLVQDCVWFNYFAVDYLAVQSLSLIAAWVFFHNYDSLTVVWRQINTRILKLGFLKVRKSLSAEIQAVVEEPPLNMHCLR